MQTAHCPDHRLERIVKAWLEEPRSAKQRPEAVKVRVTFECGAQNIVMMSQANYEDARQ